MARLQTLSFMGVGLGGAARSAAAGAIGPCGAHGSPVAKSLDIRDGSLILGGPDVSRVPLRRLAQGGTAIPQPRVRAKSKRIRSVRLRAATLDRFGSAFLEYTL